MAVGLPDISISIGTILGGLGVLGSGILLARRKISRDSVELLKDRAEIDIIHSLIQQRDEAVQAKRQLQSELLNADIEKKTAVSKAIQLELELGQLRQRVTILKQLVNRLSAALDLTKEQLNQIVFQQKFNSSQPPGNRD